MIAGTNSFGVGHSFESGTTKIEMKTLNSLLFNSKVCIIDTPGFAELSLNARTEDLIQ